MRSIKVKKLVLTGLMTAIVCVATMVIQIPIPLGYAHLGDSCILLTAVFLGGMTGLFAGGIGSALADILTGYSQWAFFTLIIKCIMGLMIGEIARGKGEKKELYLFSFRTAAAAAAGICFMVAGYVVSGAILGGSFAAGLASAPGLIVKGCLNIIVFYVVAFALEKAKIRKLIEQ